MVDVAFIIGIVAVVAACAFIFKLVENLSQAIIMFNILFFAILVLTGIVLFTDIRNFNESFPGREKIVLVEEDGKLTSAFSWKENSTRKIDESIYLESFGKKDFKAVEVENQMIIVVDSGITGSKPDYNEVSAAFSDTKKILSGYKDGRIKVYPEPLFFKAAKIVPQKILGEKAQNGQK